MRKSDIYQSGGCKFYYDCFTCPFPDCLADTIPTLLTNAKRAEAKELAEQGMAKQDISERLGVSKRQVERYLAT